MARCHLSAKATAMHRGSYALPGLRSMPCWLPGLICAAKSVLKRRPDCPAELCVAVRLAELEEPVNVILLRQNDVTEHKIDQRAGLQQS
jgi:hypothetical protein